MTYLNGPLPLWVLISRHRIRSATSFGNGVRGQVTVRIGTELGLARR